MNSTLSFGQAAAMQLYQALLPFAFFCCVAGFIASAVQRVDLHGWLKTIALTALIAGATVGFPTGIQTVQQNLESLRHSVNFSSAWNDIWSQDLTQNKKPPFYDVANCVGYFTAMFAQFVGSLSVLFILWLQGIAINGLIAVSPLLLGMLALEWTRSIGINFLLTSFGVVLWSVGIAIVNVTLANLATPLLSMAGISGGMTAAAVASTGGWVIVGGVLLGLVILSNAMYLAVPFAVGALMKGANPLLAGTTAGAGLAGAGLEIATKLGAIQAVGGGLQKGANALGSAVSADGFQPSLGLAPAKSPAPALAYPSPGAGVPLGEERVGGFTGSRTRSGSSSPAGALPAPASSEAQDDSTPMAMTSESVPSGARSVGPSNTEFRQSIMAKYNRRNTVAAIDAPQIQGGN